MKAYIASTFSDEEGPMAEEGKTVYIQASKEHLLELANFFQSVANDLQESEKCHRHFRDHSINWDKTTHIDIAVDLNEHT